MITKNYTKSSGISLAKMTFSQQVRPMTADSYFNPQHG